MSASDPLTDAQYAAVEEAMVQTDLGRAFLDEYGRRASTVRAAEIIGALSDIKRSIQAQSASTHIEILRRELQEMSASIMQTRSEIAAIKPEDSGNSRIMAATGELDVIVSATERATTDILASAEHLQDVAEKLRGDGAAEALCDEIEAQVTNIFTACSFQDITGQRTTKVVSALHYLEHRVNAMIDIWGIDGIKPSDGTGASDLSAAPIAADPADPRPDAHLLHGPQNEDEATSQDEIDRILQDAMAD